jgi:hypothetical protein
MRRSTMAGLLLAALAATVLLIPGSWAVWVILAALVLVGLAALVERLHGLEAEILAFRADIDRELDEESHYGQED